MTHHISEKIEEVKAELQQVVRDEVRAAIKEAWPKTSGPISNIGPNPNGNYREIVQ